MEMRMKMFRSRSNSIAKGCFPAVSGERGSALLEFAFVIVLLLTIMFGIIDFSRAMYADHWVSSAARDATRWASVRGSGCALLTGGCPAASSDVSTYVQSIVPAGVVLNGGTSGPGGLLVQTNWPGTNGSGTSCVANGNPSKSAGCVVKIQVTYFFGFLPLLSKFGPITMSSTSQMTISN